MSDMSTNQPVFRQFPEGTLDLVEGDAFRTPTPNASPSPIAKHGASRMRRDSAGNGMLEKSSAAATLANANWERRMPQHGECQEARAADAASRSISNLSVQDKNEMAWPGKAVLVAKAASASRQASLS